MQKYLFFLVLYILSGNAKAQELYVYTEPASNVPAKSVSVKLMDRFVTSDNIYNRFSHRLMPQITAGLSKKVMLRAGASFSNMHTTDFRYESVSLYLKYRFLSSDELHKHFRMAFFANASATKAPFHYDEISLSGDKGGIEAGIVATQLWHKLAVSSTVTHTQALHKSRSDKVLYVPVRSYQAMNYSLSAGYLVFPKEYTDYKQVNLNLYLEIFGQQLLDKKGSYFDMAPAVQLIFGSNTRLNLGYRFQAAGNIQRMANSGWQLSVERIFLNALRN
ncbi:MAG: hypothetical protein JNM88_11745 [Chitinophagaceae bacterium]|nr:hypothetical protein [Chitinophagaceae bacterium]